MLPRKNMRNIHDNMEEKSSRINYINFNIHTFLPNNHGYKGTHASVKLSKNIHENMKKIVAYLIKIQHIYK